MDRPRVTVAMPVQNCASTVGAAVRSVVAQSFEDWTLLALDDGSSDDTVERLRMFSDDRIRVLSDGLSLGLPARLNQAIDLAKDKYFARMDGDDIAYPERLERQVRHLESSPSTDLVGSRMLVFGSGGEPLGQRLCPEGHSRISAHPFSGFPMYHPSWCGRRAWFTAYGYRNAAVRCEDQDLLLRSWRHSRFANVPAILMGYREPHIDLRKVLPGRYHLVRSVAGVNGGWGRIGTARAAFEQAAKGVVDTLAVSLGLESALLGHRHRPLADSERARWAEVWRSCNEP
jgi:glycosyltransferase involved in cell wall biosynthesis